jgi:hypothetical protein
MVRYTDEIPEFVLPWVAKQKVFWVATAALSNDGLINLSPKGIDGTFNIVNPRKVWFEDLSGSGACGLELFELKHVDPNIFMLGIATVAHVRENGRITILFNAFEGFPRILRIYGKGPPEPPCPIYLLISLFQRSSMNSAHLSMKLFFRQKNDIFLHAQL